MRPVYYIKYTYLNLGKDERCTPRIELTESARLTPVLGAAISSWRVEVSKPMKLFVVVLDSDDYVGRARSTTAHFIPSGISRRIIGVVPE